VVMMRKILIALFLLLFCPVNVLRAQGQEQESQDHKHQRFAKLGFVHTESEMEGFKIAINGLSVDFETYFNRNHIGLSGWFIGYRKDDLRYKDFGHLLNGGVFRTVGMPMTVDLKVSGGLEWGSVSSSYNQTRFNYDGLGLISYENLFLNKNTSAPKLGPGNNTALYPFVEVSLVKKWSRFLLETGVRGSIQKFGFDKYDLHDDSLSFVSSDRTRIVPALFIKLGLALGGPSAPNK